MSRRVLVVEDEADILLTITLTLQMRGFEVIETPSGEAALEVLERDHPDAVILDLRLPGMDGWELLERMRDAGLFPKIPVVIASAHSDSGSAARAREMGVGGYLTKPFGIAELERVIDELLGPDGG